MLFIFQPTSIDIRIVILNLEETDWISDDKLRYPVSEWATSSLQCITLIQDVGGVILRWTYLMSLTCCVCYNGSLTGNTLHVESHKPVWIPILLDKSVTYIPTEFPRLMGWHDSTAGNLQNTAASYVLVCCLCFATSCYYWQRPCFLYGAVILKPSLDIVSIFVQQCDETRMIYNWSD